MIAFIIQFVIAILVIILIIAFFISANRESEEKRKKRVLVEQSAKKAREASNAQRRETLLQMLPNPDIVVEYSDNGFSSGNLKLVLVKDSTSQILLNDNLYNFDDIIDFSLLDKQTVIQHHSGSTAETNTSTGSMIGRAVVGGVLTGGVGAAIGAATAKKETIIQPSTSYSSTKHHYVINVTINSITNPIETLCFFHNENTARKVASILQVILHRKNGMLPDNKKYDILVANQ